MIASCYRSRI